MRTRVSTESWYGKALHEAADEIDRLREERDDAQAETVTQAVALAKLRKLRDAVFRNIRRDGPVGYTEEVHNALEEARDD